MLPLNDTEPSRYTSLPFMVLSIIAINILVMAYEFGIAYDGGEQAYLAHLYSFATIPTLILHREGGGALTAITHMFMHGGLLHLGGNMLFLWVYGRRVEDVCGPWRFLVFYLCCGVFADIVSTAVSYNSDVPAVGASGAVAGIIGAYLILFPTGRIRTMIVFYFVPTFPAIRAYWLILYWFLIEQLPFAINALVNQADYDIGYWAHIGGFFASLLIFLFLRPQVFHNYQNDLTL